MGRASFTTDDFIKKAIAVHGNRFNYSKSKYTSAKNKIEIECPNHGVFTTRASHHLDGKAGCRKCIKGPNISTAKWIQKAILVHGDIFDYSKTVYTGSKSKLLITCPHHGDFEIVANKHLSGQRGCKECKKESLSKLKMSTTPQWVNKAVIAHDDKYNYDHSAYVNAKQKILITCPVHGDFYQEAESHLQGTGCPKCTAGHHVSRGCTEWLNSLEISEDNREVKNLCENFIVDGYDPSTNTVYEFHGDYWHGNPDLYDADQVNPSVGLTYGELYQRTYNKREALRSHGYNVVEMWEYNWNTNRKPRSFPKK